MCPNLVTNYEKLLTTMSQISKLAVHITLLAFAVIPTALSLSNQMPHVAF